MAAAAAAPPAAALTTCAMTSVTLPATHTPGTSVSPVGSAAIDSPMPIGCAVGSRPRPVSTAELATSRGATATAEQATTVPTASRRPVIRSSVTSSDSTGPVTTRMPQAVSSSVCCWVSAGAVCWKKVTSDVNCRNSSA